MFLVGDKVRVRNHSNNITGTVVELVVDYSYGATDYVVEFDDKNLIPSRMTYSYWQLEYIKSVVSKCECGLTYAREGGKHSDWCPLFEKENN